MEKISKIWRNPFDLVALWAVKFADNPAKARTVDAEKDSYDRQDNYNAQGVAVYAYLHLKK